MSDSDLFDHAVGAIEAKYAELKYDRGWRFFFSPRSTLKANCGLLLVGLNPADRVGFEPKAMPSSEEGNAFRLRAGIASVLYAERVCDIFQKLAAILGEPWEPLMDRTPMSNFCPFRASGGLPKEHRAEARAFSRALWRALCQHLQPRVIMCLGEEARQEFGAVRGNQSPIRIVPLPHPSSRISNDLRSELHRTAVSQVASLLNGAEKQPRVAESTAAPDRGRPFGSSRVEVLGGGPGR
jgi:hypothetical protein